VRKFKFENVMIKLRETEQRKNDTKEKVFEFEFYDILFRLLDVLDAFEEGRRDPLRSADQYELLNKLNWCYNALKKNIEYIEYKESED